MKQLKLSAAATILTLALSFSAFAGDIWTTVTSPATTQASATTSATTSSTSSTGIAVDPLTQMLLALLNLAA